MATKLYKTWNAAFRLNKAFARPKTETALKALGLSVPYFRKWYDTFEVSDSQSSDGKATFYNAELLGEWLDSKNASRDDFIVTYGLRQLEPGRGRKGKGPKAAVQREHTPRNRESFAVDAPDHIEIQEVEPGVLDRLRELSGSGLLAVLRIVKSDGAMPPDSKAAITSALL